MKRILAAAVLGCAGLAAIAASCVVENHRLTTFDNHDTFAGDLRNDSGVNILNHKFQVAFVNSNGAVVEQFMVDGCLRSLQTGASDFFSATSTRPDESTTLAVARLANLAEDPDFEVGTTRDGELTFSNVTAARVGEVLTVAGTVTNDDADLDDPAVCVVVRDEDGLAVTTGKDDSLGDLDEGASAVFSVTLAVPGDSDLVDHVDIWADGLENGVPTDPESKEEVEVGVTLPSTPAPAPTSTPVP